MPSAARAPTDATWAEKLAKPPPSNTWSAANPTILPIDPDLRPHFKGVSFDPQLKLLEAVVGKPDGTIREEHPRQRDVERERRVVASAESAAARRAIGADMRGLEGRLGIAKQIRD